MEYQNEFHRISTERKLKQIEEWAKNPPSALEASKKQFEMHKETARLYPNEIHEKDIKESINVSLSEAIKNRQTFKQGLELQVHKLMEEQGYSRKEALLLIKEVLEDNEIIRKFPTPEVKK